MAVTSTTGITTVIPQKSLDGVTRLQSTTDGTSTVVMHLSHRSLK